MAEGSEEHEPSDKTYPDENIAQEREVIRN
jgi:hypothetical protein